MRSIRLARALAGCAAALLMELGGAQSQVVTAQGACSVASMASGRARVIVNNHCDSNTAATVQRLLDKSRAVDERNRAQDTKLRKLDTRIKRGWLERNTLLQRVEELISAVRRRDAAPGVRC